MYFDTKQPPSNKYWLATFLSILNGTKIEAVHVNWEPKPKLEKEVEDILDKIDD